MISGEAANWLLSIVMMAVAALVWGGVKLLRNPDERRRGVLMLAAAVVVLGNVLIWVIPV